jgi:hypothetical protein
MAMTHKTSSFYVTATLNQQVLVLSLLLFFVCISRQLIDIVIDHFETNASTRDLPFSAGADSLRETEFFER